jgi:hypothetical protein
MRRFLGRASPALRDAAQWRSDTRAGIFDIDVSQVVAALLDVVMRRRA